MNEIPSYLPPQPQATSPRRPPNPPMNINNLAEVSGNQIAPTEGAYPMAQDNRWDANTPQYYYNYGRKITNKSKGTAVALALLIGSIGAHYFYLGKSGRGLLYIVLCPLLISPILALIDALRLAIMSKDEFAQKFGVD